MPSLSSMPFKASATVPFEKLDDYLEPFIESLSTHDMTICKGDGVYDIASPFGKASFRPGEGEFRLTAEAADPANLNRLKHALVGPIGFIAARENPVIEWEGDKAAPALPDDLRILRVARVSDLTPNMRRLVFSGENLQRYDRPDQLHCRLIFQPRDMVKPSWPMLDDRGHVVWPDGGAVPTRVYTIRKIDGTRQEITVDFALHENPGPATRWAMDARPGDIAGILGPAADGPKDADFHVLIGDETALPGIARILEEMPQAAIGHAIIEVANPQEELPLVHPKGVTLTWLHRQDAAPGTTELLFDALQTVAWPDDLSRAFLWGGSEHKIFSRIYRHLKNEIKLPRDRFTLHSHWHRRLSEEEIIAKGGEAYLPSDH
ncbi:siderophore-interacting protein [Rhizobium paknamense]|uniref:NADPH-dependent ferric siderophore reductase n=1 Tax=Rhizobium paknamense TaxID=1206817 RepID=A0ABU0IK15_9HYPH|nr:siderophore-interacting protein [Rhizobium paknamense]MDQ0457775.1 NADPH-dependent ferric siderophore reductase [Rhizobium paknamense]